MEAPRIVTKRLYLIALACYIAIPVVVIAGGFLAHLIDPEMARGTANYEANFRLLQMVAGGVLMVGAGLALALWLATCAMVLVSRRRSLWWLLLAAAGPFGFMFIAMLSDRAPAPADLYQEFIRKLKMAWRIPLEIGLFFAIWTVAYQFVVLKRELSIRYESYATGTPVETIVARQEESSGMYAFSEGLEEFFLVILLYLLWPIAFNLAARVFRRSRA